MKKFIPYVPSTSSLIKWKEKFTPEKDVLLDKLLSHFPAFSEDYSCGFVSENGTEILCCRGAVSNECWISVRLFSEAFVEDDERIQFLEWLVKGGYAKKRC